MIGFDVGDRVKYISGRHGRSLSNPMINTEYECTGTVDASFGKKRCTVLWDNGEHNSYDTGDLAHSKIGEPGKLDPNTAFRMKKWNTKHIFGSSSSLYYAGKKVYGYK